MAETTGTVDRDERLRVSIITGIDKAHPASYRIVIGVNPSLIKVRASGAHFVMISRINTMEPPDSRNLNFFLKEFKRIGKYILLPAHFVGESKMPRFFIELGIQKSKLYVRPAWQIDKNDFDISGISEDDDFIVPDGVKDPPVVRALQQISKFRRGLGK